MNASIERAAQHPLFSPENLSDQERARLQNEANRDSNAIARKKHNGRIAPH